MSSNTQPNTMEKSEKVRKTPAYILEAQKKYTARKRQDPEYVAYHHQKAVEWRIRKYKEDEEFREKAKAYAREYGRKRRAELKMLELQQQAQTIKCM